jgi:Anti-sigma factor NepR
MSGEKTNGLADFGLFAVPRPPRPKPGLKSRSHKSLEADIGETMRAMYNDLLEQPIPDRFVELLKQIDQAQENRSR